MSHHQENVCIGTIIYPQDDAFQQQQSASTHTHNNNPSSPAPFNATLPIHFQQPQHQVVWATNPQTGQTVVFPVVPAMQHLQSLPSSPRVGGTASPIQLFEYPEPNTQDWSTGLCDCFRDVEGSLEGLFCNRCQLSRQYGYLSNGVKDIDLPSFFFSCVADALAAPVGIWALGWWTRRGVRRRYGIKGNDVTDCLTSLCCGPCTTCQQYREMSIRQEWPTGCCIEEPYSLPQHIRIMNNNNNQQQQQQQVQMHQLNNNNPHQQHEDNTSMM